MRTSPGNPPIWTGHHVPWTISLVFLITKGMIIQRHAEKVLKWKPVVPLGFESNCQLKGKSDYCPITCSSDYEGHAHRASHIHTLIRTRHRLIAYVLLLMLGKHPNSDWLMYRAQVKISVATSIVWLLVYSPPATQFPALNPMADKFWNSGHSNNIRYWTLDTGDCGNILTKEKPSNSDWSMYRVQVKSSDTDGNRLPVGVLRSQNFLPRVPWQTNSETWDTATIFHWRMW